MKENETHYCVLANIAEYAFGKTVRKPSKCVGYFVCAVIKYCPHERDENEVTDFFYLRFYHIGNSTSVNTYQADFFVATILLVP